MVDLAESAARKKVYFSNLRLGHFGYTEGKNDVPVMLGLMDFKTVYFELDDKRFAWYVVKTKATLEKELKKVFGK
jgi:hypothetical protein